MKQTKQGVDCLNSAIKMLEVVQAVKAVNNDVIPKDAAVKRLAASLKAYWHRHEFDGSVESAIECLKRSGYIEREL